MDLHELLRKSMRGENVRKAFRRSSFVVILFLALSGYTVEDKPTCLSLMLPRLDFAAATIIEALQDIRQAAGAHEFVFTLEVAPFATAPDKNLTLHAERLTVAQALQRVVELDRRYTFELAAQGVIHVFPAALRSDATDLLNVPVQRLQISAAYDQILQYPQANIPELQVELMRRSQLSGQAMSMLSDPNAPKIQVSLERGTVRDVLNRAADGTLKFRDREPAGWVYTFRIDRSIPLGGSPEWRILY